MALWRGRYQHGFILNLKFEVATCFEKLVSAYETTWPHISEGNNYNPFTLKTQPDSRVKEIIGVFACINIVCGQGRQCLPPYLNL